MKPPAARQMLAVAAVLAGAAMAMFMTWGFWGYAAPPPWPLAAYAQVPNSGASFSDFCGGNTTGNLFTNCGYDDNFLGAALLPFIFITGGWLPMVFWGVICLTIYAKYRTYLYPAVVGAVTMIGTGIWLPNEVQTFMYLALGTGLACTAFILFWRIPRDQS